MGLSVKVYQNIQETTSEDYDFSAYVIDDDWKWKIKNLKEGQRYTGKLVDNEIHCPYSAHGRFRENLLKLTGNEDCLTEKGLINWHKIHNELPFYDFINFADNEGCLDWQVSEVIYCDFLDWELEAKNFDTTKNNAHPFFYERYKQWFSVFEKAKEMGVVVFG